MRGQRFGWSVLAVLIALGCGSSGTRGTRGVGSRGFGESCEFVTGSTATNVIEYSPDSQCESDYCMDFMGERYCTIPCESDEDCPEGRCLPVSLEPGAPPFCVLIPGTPTACQTIGDYCDTGEPGVCAEGLCQPAAGGALECVARNTPAESDIPGNGLDDDCDGSTDEDNIGAECFTDLSGLCAIGHVDSNGDCQPDVLPGEQEEVCEDFMSMEDEDCDGDYDESDPREGEDCDTGRPGICAAGIWDCQASNYCAMQTMPGDEPEVCDDLDNDCNGMVDDDGITEGIWCRIAWELVLADDTGGVAAGAGGRVYATAQNGQLLAIDPDGSVAWEVPFSAESVYQPPVVSPDGSVIIAIDSRSTIAAYSADADPLWTASADSADAVIHPDGTTFVTGRPGGIGSEAQLFALDPNGTELWRVPLGWTAGVRLMDEAHLWLTQSDLVEVRDLTGTLLWSIDADAGLDPVVSPPVVLAGVWLAVVSASDGTHVVGLEPEMGLELWRTPPVGLAPSGGSAVSAAVSPSEGLAFFSVEGEFPSVTVVAIEADGTVLWQKPIDMATDVALAATPGGLALLGAPPGVVMLSMTDGTELWSLARSVDSIAPHAAVLEEAGLAVSFDNEEVFALDYAE